MWSFCSIYADYYSGNFFISSADAYGCKIEVNSATALAKPNNQQQLGYSTYSCTPSSSSTQYEVHVLSVYEVINRRPPTAGNANVNIVSRGKSNRPIVLVLASYEPVNWILHLPVGISISKVVLVRMFSCLGRKKILNLFNNWDQSLNRTPSSIKMLKRSHFRKKNALKLSVHLFTRKVLMQGTLFSRLLVETGLPFVVVI